MIDVAHDYLATLEQDAIQNPKFAINMIVSAYKNGGDFITSGEVTNLSWDKTISSYVYELYVKNIDDYLYVSEDCLDRFYIPYGARTVRSHWFFVIKGGK